MKNLTRADVDSIEAIMDRTSLFAVLESIVGICFDKSQHISENWQDKSLAREWERAGKVVDKAANADVIGRLT
ncbi:MAG: hypothetical protein AB7P97_20355 [Hyphomonadaceae bacterium]